MINQFDKINLSLHGVILPEIKIEEKKNNESNHEFLTNLTRKGFKEKLFFLEKNSELYNKYIERVKYELSLFEEFGFTDYILIVWDVINYCRKNNIATGMGRGSCCGSLVLFLIDVTKIDPIKYDLYFERFVSRSRAKKTVIDGVIYLDGSLMPDVDLDIAYHQRDQVVKYIDEKYKGKTSKIMTLNTLSGKLLIKECGKCIDNCSEQEVNDVSNMIPKIHGNVADIEDAYNEVKEFRDWCDKHKEVYNIALKLRDLIKNKGSHASGYVIAYKNLEDFLPLELTSDKHIVSGYDMNWVGNLCVKLDLLGLRSASLIHDVCNMVGIKAEDINVNDPIIYEFLNNLNYPHGIFQIEADTNFRVCKKVKPKNLDQLSDVLALARPGAIQFVNEYADYSNNDRIQSVHKDLDKVFAKTGGLCLYQEQIMRAIHEVFGLTLDDAENARRGIGKKKKEVIAKFEKMLKDQTEKLGLENEVFEKFWKIMNDSASYSFNASHSYAYAALSAITAYLKLKYPKEFYLSLLKLSRFEPDSIGEIEKIQKEMVHFGIKLLPPHLIKSDMDFTIEGNNIRYGLLSIKGVSEKKMEKISRFKDIYKNRFEVFQAASQNKIDIGVLSALIQAGTLDEDFDVSRCTLVYECQLWNLLTNREKQIALEKAKEFNYKLLDIIKFLKQAKTENGKPVLSEKRLQTLRQKSDLYNRIYNKNRKNEKFANWYFETKLLGYSFSHSLTSIFQEFDDEITNIETIKDMIEDSPCKTVGSIVEVGEFKSKAKQTPTLKAIIADSSSSITCLMFTKDRIDAHKRENGRNLKEGDIVLIEGRKKGDAIFCDSIRIQDKKIYTKLSELKKDLTSEENSV